MVKYLKMSSFDSALVIGACAVGPIEFVIKNNRGQSKRHRGEIVSERPNSFNGSLYARIEVEENDSGETVGNSLAIVTRETKLLSLHDGRRVRVIGANDYDDGLIDYIDESGTTHLQSAVIRGVFTSCYVSPGIVGVVKSVPTKSGVEHRNIIVIVKEELI